MSGDGVLDMCTCTVHGLRVELEKLVEDIFIFDASLGIAPIQG